MKRQTLLCKFRARSKKDLRIYKLFRCEMIVLIQKPFIINYLFKQRLVEFFSFMSSKNINVSEEIILFKELIIHSFLLLNFNEHFCCKLNLLPACISSKMKDIHIGYSKGSPFYGKFFRASCFWKVEVLLQLTLLLSLLIGDMIHAYVIRLKLPFSKSSFYITLKKVQE